MWSAASVLACALAVLGRSESSMPPIVLIDAAPPEVSFGAEAYVRFGTIHLITSAPAFREAARRRDCGESREIRKLASVLAHEEWHVRRGPDEQAAYEHQLITLIRLGLSPGSSVFREVQVSMIHVVAARKRNQPSERLLARRE